MFAVGEAMFMDNVGRVWNVRAVTDALDAPSGPLPVLMTVSACTKMMVHLNESIEEMQMRKKKVEKMWGDLLYEEYWLLKKQLYYKINK